MSTVTPFLWFDTEAKEAAEFYTSVFPNSRITKVTTRPDRSEETVLTVEFDLDDRRFIALNGGPQYSFTEAFSLSIDCRTQDEVDRYWATLTEGGEEGPCGWLKDRYGLSWQVVPEVLPRLLTDPDRDKADRVFAAMMTMKKIDIAELERAADGAASRR
ncbi:MAG TPA: VOC family protein [Gaiellales bacterium]|jgi:predicted 3-demethylubiquinone-9 3-methyltransferase (glyoxalase superfamily)|nr:VOC family protein [Gaiellales bacterium]